MTDEQRVRGVRSLIATPRVDMDYEDRALLHPDLLRDDATAVDMVSG